MVRFFQIVCILFLFISCDYFSFKKNANQQEIDTVVNLTSVDVYPSFKVCDAIIDKDKKETCFRTTIHEFISNSLIDQKIQVRKKIDEVVMLKILITSKGEINLKELSVSEEFQSEIPDFRKMIEKSLEDLPKVYPAIKRSIPVTSEYTLPIRIKLEN